jgi:hypothetical protein
MRAGNGRHRVPKSAVVEVRVPVSTHPRLEMTVTSTCYFVSGTACSRSVSGNDVGLGGTMLLRVAALHCTALRLIDVSHCGLTELPTQLCRLTAEDATVVIAGNPLEFPPRAVAVQDWPLVRVFLHHAAADDVVCNRYSIVVVGAESGPGVMPVLKQRLGECLVSEHFDGGGGGGGSAGTVQRCVFCHSSADDPQRVISVTEVVAPLDQPTLHCLHLLHAPFVVLVLDLDVTAFDDVVEKALT